MLDTWFSSGLLPLSALGWKGRQGESIPVSVVAMPTDEDRALRDYL